MTTEYRLRDFNSDELNEIEQELGPDGPGVVRVGNILADDFQDELIEELEDPSRVIWWDSGDNYANGRKVKIIQNHDAFALKLSAGDQSQSLRVPRMLELKEGVQTRINTLGNIFPSLLTWQADEMSYHRYYDEKVGLSYHRDNIRFTGLIAVVSVLGECDFNVVDRQPVSADYDEELDEEVVVEWDVREVHTIPTFPGDLILTRATGLFPGMSEAERPEHAVVNIRKLPRISFMLRENSRPIDTNYGFKYYNWPTA